MHAGGRLLATSQQGGQGVHVHSAVLMQHRELHGESERSTVQMQHRALLGGSATQARRSFQPPGISLKREMEVLRGLQAENDDFEDAPWRPMNKRREQVVHGANATSRTPRRQRCAGAALRSPSWQLSDSRDGGAALPTSRGR